MTRCLEKNKERRNHEELEEPDEQLVILVTGSGGEV